MEESSWTARERDSILRRWHEAERRRRVLREQRKMEEARRYSEEMTRLKTEYFAGIPRVTMGCCPFDGKPLVRSFDPFGLDGFWWDSDAAPDELPACPHFCVLAGAVNFNGKPPRAGSFEVYPGPQVPFVYPRLLEFPGMFAVIARVRMENGYLAYPITYFAEKRPPAQDLTAGWRRSVYHYQTQLGDTGFRVENDPWDFDLKPWIDKGRIRWCRPDSDNTVLDDAPGEVCPYVGLAGERANIVVQGNACWHKGLPDGRYISPYDD
jgi:hypothetical protein